MPVDPPAAAPVAADFWNSVVISGYLTIVLSVAVKLILTRIDGVSTRMDTFEKAQHACQLDNASNFVTKEDFKADADKQWGKLDDHATRLARLESRGGLNQ